MAILTEPPVSKLPDSAKRVVSGIRQASRHEFPAPKPGHRSTSSVARANSVRQQLLRAEGGSLSAENAAKVIGISQEEILIRYQKAQIIGYRAEKQNAIRFPAWQFQDRKVLKGLPEVLKVLNAATPLDDFGRMHFFLSSMDFLGGKRPLDFLCAGNVKAALRAAQGYAP